MMTFTVPAEFRSFIRSHPRECYKAIFEAASQALMVLAKDPKYIGSDQIGMTGVLHTWGRDLNYHLHVHFIVPGGAISKSGTEWLSSGVNYFVPVLALSKLYRGKYKALMKRCGLLDQINDEVWRKGWNVNCQAVGDGVSAEPTYYRLKQGPSMFSFLTVGSGWLNGILLEGQRPHCGICSVAKNCFTCMSVAVGEQAW